MTSLFRVVVYLLWVCTTMTGSAALAGSDELTISPDRQFSYADTLFTDQDFRTAEVEFKRFVHFFPGDSRVPETKFKIGMTLLFQEQFHEAARQFNDMIRNDPELVSLFTTEAYFMQSRAFRQMGNMGYARVILQNLLLLADDPAVLDRTYLDLASLHIQASREPGTDELDQALEILEKISPDSLLSAQRNERISRIRKVRSMPEKNPTLAGLFAAFPGAGFLYTGRFHDAAAAFIVNTGLGLAAWKAFDQDNPALGTMVGLAGFGFYSGSIYGSVSAAHKHNHNQKIRILDRDVTFSTGVDFHGNGVFFSFSRGF